MPSNSTLIDEVDILAKKLGMVVNTQPLNNAALAALLSDLKAKYKAMRNSDDGESDSVEENSETQPVSNVVSHDTYVVVKGKAITCKRGVLSDGDEVKTEYFNDGMTVIKDLYTRGYLEIVAPV